MMLPIRVKSLPPVLHLAPNVVVLGVVSFLMDVSSEMTLTVLPLFLSGVLGASPSMIGLIEGIADSTNTGFKVISGWLSDLRGKRKGLTTFGYSISTVAKPFLYFATTWSIVLGIRFADRVGKGVRTAPRDALLAESTTNEDRGKSFGFHRAMDTGGAVVGLGIAAAVVYVMQQQGLDLARNTFKVLVLVSIIPSVAAVLLIVFKVKEHIILTGPDRSLQPDARQQQTRTHSPNMLDTRFKVFLVIMVLFTLGNFSDAFMVLRAHDIGLSVLQILVLLVLFNLVYAGVSIPAGILSDRFGRRIVVAAGWSVYALIYLGFAFFNQSCSKSD